MFNLYSYIILDLMQHKKLDEMHDMIRRVQFPNKQCPRCQKIFSQTVHVQRHYLEMHVFVDNNLGYKCYKCSKLFKRKYEWKNHSKVC